MDLLYSFTIDERFSQISSVSFLVYTLLCVGRRTLTVGVWSPNWGVLGVYNITHCLQRKRQFARTGQISEFHIFAPPNAAQGACPRRHWQCYRILASERTVKHLLSSDVDCSRFGFCSVVASICGTIVFGLRNADSRETQSNG